MKRQLEITSESKFNNEGDTKITLGGIRRSLKHSLQNRFPQKSSKWIGDKVDRIIRLNGLHPDNFNVMKMFTRHLNGKTNYVSIDDNANKSDKSVASIMCEINKSNQKMIGFDFMYRTLKEMYGKRRAKYLMGRMFDYSLGMSDSTNLLVPYCVAINGSRLVTDGRDYGTLHSVPAKHFGSYTGQLQEQVHEMSNHLAGAIAVGTYFLDMARTCMMDKITLGDLDDSKIRKEITQRIQSFIHSMNSLSRFGGTESPFTNLSIFDYKKLKYVLSEAMGWYFDGVLYSLEDRIKYVMKIQEIFLDFFNAGDPNRDGEPYRFPVVTFNLSKKFDEEKGVFVLTDEKFLKWFTDRYDIRRFNIFASEGTKVASCCFDGSEMIEVDNKLISIKDFVESHLNGFGEMKIDGGTIESYNPITGESEDANIVGVLKKPNDTGILIEINVGDNIIKVTPDHLIMVKDVETGEVSEIQAYQLKDNTNLMLLTVSKEWKTIKSINEVSHHSPVYDIELDKNHYFGANGIISHNCRLVNDVELLDMAASSNGFGAGALSDIGSHRVISPNFARPAYECESFEEYMAEVATLLEEAKDILIAHKAMIMHFTNMPGGGIHKFIKNGWINMSRMFSTFGIIGTVEAQDILTKKFGEYDYQADILKFVSEKCMQYTKENKGYSFNSEVIPGESYCVRLCKVDTMLYGEEAVPYKLYSNQFVPLWKKANSVYEKMDIDGKYNSMITGGMINHIPFDGRVTPSQARKLIRYAVKVGCEHFALNGTYSRCANGHCTDDDVDVCPRCGAKIVDKVTRVIGFFTPVSQWNETRQLYDFARRVKYSDADL